MVQNISDHANSEQALRKLESGCAIKVEEFAELKMKYKKLLQHTKYFST